MERLSRNTPTLLPMENYIGFLDAMHNERDHIYEKYASLTIDSDDSKYYKTYILYH